MTYPRPLQLLHWSVAILVTCQLAIAVVLTQLRSLGYGQLVLSMHRQIGLVILLLVLARFLAGKRHAAPKPVSSGLPGWQIATATWVHRLFYLMLVAQPVIGILVAWGRGDSLTLFGLVPLPAPFEVSEVARERLMTAHTVAAGVLSLLCVLHVGAVVFNHIVRRVPILERMLPPVPEERLVNRVSLAKQLTFAFGVVVAIALLMGLNAVATYRELGRATAAHQAGDLAVADQLRSAQVAWKELAGLVALNRAEDAARLRELADSARSSLEDAATHATPGVIATGLRRMAAGMTSAVPSEGAVSGARVQAIDTNLQELFDSQTAETFQHQTDNDERAARGHDLIVLTVLPMLLAGLITGLLLARSITGSLGRMSRLIRCIESDSRGVAVDVIGAGEFAALTRDIVNMRTAVEARSNAAAARQAQFDAERARLAEEQQAREIAAERLQRAEREAQREQLAAAFEHQMAGIVSTVSGTARQLTSTASTMADSASSTSQHSREASSVAERTSGTASLIATGAAELSNTAQSVRENAEQSKARAGSAVEEAAAAKQQIDVLVEAARQIGSITDMIAAVARQTNLLAINARVEAARAGDVGRGFSVVANEIKDLSDQTRAATHRIAKQIEEVTSAASISSQSLQRLREVIAGLEGAAAAIFTATDEQFASTRDIAERVSDISASASSVARNIRAAEAAAGTTEHVAGDVMQAADVMDEQAEELREQVARFVLQLRNVRSSASREAEPISFAAAAERRRA